MSRPKDAAAEDGDGALLSPGTELRVEIYTDERKAELLLANAVDERDHAWAVQEVRKLGIDPDTITERIRAGGKTS